MGYDIERLKHRKYDRSYASSKLFRTIFLFQADTTSTNQRPFCCII